MEKEKITTESIQKKEQFTLEISNIQDCPFPSDGIIDNFTSIVDEVISEIEENKTKDINIQIGFIVGTGSFDGKFIYLPSSIDSYPRHRESTQYEMFLTYFKHELVHALAYFYWRDKNGTPPAFVNEGIAQYLSEFFFIKNAYGFGYDELTKCFIEDNKYVPFEKFLISNIFLELRKDPRIMIENASFIGYLWRELGKENFRELFSISRNFSNMEEEETSLKQNFKSIYNKNLEELEVIWIEYIKNLPKVNDDCSEFSKKY
jgi:hypothetical protein